MGDIQSVDKSNWPCSLHWVMENLPKLARIKFILEPKSQSIVSCLSSQAYIVLYLALACVAVVALVGSCITELECCWAGGELGADAA